MLPMSCRYIVQASTYAVLVVGAGACAQEPTLSEDDSDVRGVHHRSHSHRNPGGKAASFSTQGLIDLGSEFFRPQGINGRHCGTCHAPEDGWSLTPQTIERLFDDTDGLHPLFSRLDADRPGITTAQLQAMTIDERRAAFSMLLEGKFTRSVAPPATRDYDVIAASDPFGVGTTSKLWFFRRPLSTANFKSQTVMWDSGNTIAGDLHAGLVKQARGNVTGAQEGPAATDAVIFEIVDFEIQMSHAQLKVRGAGRLDADGATGGPEAHASQPLIAGRFDLYDAWQDSCNPRRAQIFRGQELFNNGDAGGRKCSGCHDAANSGQNVAGKLFDVGTSRPEFANPNMAVYTFSRRSDGAIVQTTDPGRCIRSGLFADLNRFKTPSLRGLAARAPYFHNGISATLADVVTFYEQARGFDFTDDEEADLVAFLNAL